MTEQNKFCGTSFHLILLSIIFVGMKPRDPQKIERIHQATLVLVSEIGLAGLTMSKIAKAAKLGMGTIYTYFNSKEEVLNALYQSLKIKHAEKVYANFDKNQSFLPNYRAIFKSFFQNAYHKEAEYFFLEQCRAAPFLTLDSIVLEEAAFAPMNSLLDEGKAQKIVKNMDNGLLIGYMMGGVQGLITQLRRNNTPLTNAIIEDALTLSLNSIKV